MAGYGVGPDSSIAEVIEDTFYIWQWMAPNSRFNQTDDLYLWGQINTYHDEADYYDMSACGVANTFNLWRFESKTTEFIPVHFPMCSGFGEFNPIHIEFDDGIDPSIVMEPVSHAIGSYWTNPISIFEDGTISMPYRVCKSDQPVEDHDVIDWENPHECYSDDGTRYYVVNYLFNQSSQPAYPLETVEAYDQHGNRVMDSSYLLLQNSEHAYLSLTKGDAIVHYNEHGQELSSIPKKELGLSDEAWSPIHNEIGDNQHYIVNNRLIDPLAGTHTEACELIEQEERDKQFVYYQGTYCLSFDTQRAGGLKISSIVDDTHVIEIYYPELYQKTIAKVEVSEKNKVATILYLGPQGGAWRDGKTMVVNLETGDVLSAGSTYSHIHFVE